MHSQGSVCVSACRYLCEDVSAEAALKMRHCTIQLMSIKKQSKGIRTVLCKKKHTHYTELIIDLLLSNFHCINLSVTICQADVLQDSRFESASSVCARARGAAITRGDLLRDFVYSAIARRVATAFPIAERR